MGIYCSGAELEPLVRAPHTVYVKTLYRIAGQDYCRHHIIRAAVAAGVITEIKPGAGPVAAMPRRANSAAYAIALRQFWASLIALGIKTVETRSWQAPERVVGQTIAIHAGKRVVKGPGDAMLATALLAGMARVAHVDPLTGHAVHDLSTEVGCAVGLGRIPIDPWGDFSAGRQCPSGIGIPTARSCRYSAGLRAPAAAPAASRCEPMSFDVTTDIYPGHALR